MFDQIVIGRKGSHDVFGASVMTRRIKDPAKKKITKTVPFSNATYDFTKINGQIYWNQRELQYVFEMIASTPEELEDMKIAFSDFVMNVIDDEIYDPFIPDYHFVGTYESKDYDDDESGEKTTVTVTFLAYPYKIANRPRIYTVNTDTNETVVVRNNSSHKIIPTITVTGEVRIVYGDISYAASTGVVEEDVFELEVGVNSFYIENLGEEDCTVEIRFSEEVF